MNGLLCLAAGIRRKARKALHPMPIKENPDSMLKERLWAGAIADGLNAQGAVDEDDVVLPFKEEIVALRVGYHSLFIGVLGDDPEWGPLDRRLRPLLNQAAIAWSWLGAEGEDLLLLLVGPLGSDRDERWLRVQREIERDELICRKLVWLPAKEETARKRSLVKFIGRTFLSRPWRGRAVEGPLDALAVLPKLLETEQFSEQEASRWLTLLAREDLKPQELARELIAALDTSP